MGRWRRSLAGRVCRWSALAGLLVFSLARSGNAAGLLDQIPRGLIVFPDVTAAGVNNATRPGEDDTINPAVDFFYASDLGRLRVLAESLLDEHTQELERFQIGWRMGAKTTAWIGRVHNPLGYWNTAFHHGKYLQTSIGRPGIVEFEDDGGVLPMHVSGLLLQGMHTMAGAEILYEATAGVAGELDSKGLDPLNLLDPTNGKVRFASGLKLSLKSDLYKENEIGVFAGYSELPSDTTAINRVEQTVAGTYLLAKYHGFRVLGAGFHVSNRIRASTSHAQAFLSGYVQGEYALSSAWSVYARAEGSDGVQGNAYLALFPGFVRQRLLAGLRVELSHRQALKVEFQDTRRLTTDLTGVLLQWSAAFP